MKNEIVFENTQREYDSKLEVLFTLQLHKHDVFLQSA